MCEEMLHWKNTQFLLAVEFDFHWGWGEKFVSIMRKDLQHPLNTSTTCRFVVCIFFFISSVSERTI